MSKIVLLRKFPVSGGGGGGVPTLDTMSPNSSFTDTVSQTIIGVALTGTNLDGANPQINVAAGWSVANLVVVGSTDATFDLTIPANKPAGTYNLNFQTDDGTSNVLVFTIEPLETGGSYLTKLAAPGVFSGVSFDSTSNVFAPGLGLPVQPMNYSWLPEGGACDIANPGGVGPGGSDQQPSRDRDILERLCLAAEQNGACYFPEIDNTIYHVAGGGTGSLKLTIPSQSDSRTGGYVWLPWKGIGTNFYIGPNHANGGIVYLQWRHRYSSEFVTPTTGLIAQFPAATGFTGQKQMIIFGPPPADDSSLLSIVSRLNFQNGLFQMYGQQGNDVYETAAPGGGIYLQNAALCLYLGSSAFYGDYVAPCLVMVPNHWYEMTESIELRPVASDFVVSGNTLSRTGTFAEANYPVSNLSLEADVYIVGDGFFNITAKINDNSVTLSGSPAAGSGKSVYIANYPNTRVRQWVDGMPCLDIPFAKVFWGRPGNGFGWQGGFGSSKFIAHMTGKDATVVHDTCHVWMDDFIASTEPISMVPTNSLGLFAASMAPGTWSAYNTTNMDAAFTNTNGATGMIIPYAMEGVWDSELKRVHILGSDHGQNPSGPTFRHIYLDSLTNQWVDLGEPSWYFITPTQYADAHPYHLTAIDVAGRKLYRMPYGRPNLHVFDLDAGTWTDAPVNPEGIVSGVGTIAFFPERNCLMYASGSGAIWEFRVASQTWVDVTPGSPTGLSSTWQWSNYNPVRQEVQFGTVHDLTLSGTSANQLWRYSVSGTWTQLNNIPGAQRCYSGSGYNGEWVADPSGKYLVMTDPDNGTGRNIYEFNAATQTYTILSNQIPDKKLPNGNYMVIPIPEYNITMWCWAKGFSAGIFLYKHTG